VKGERYGRFKDTNALKDMCFWYEPLLLLHV